MIFKGIKGGKELKMLANKKIKNYYTKVRNESDLQQYMKKIKNGGKKNANCTIASLQGICRDLNGQETYYQQMKAFLKFTREVNVAPPAWLVSQQWY